MSTRRQVLLSSLGFAASLAACGRALAQVTTKQVHLIVGFPPGGGTDIVARVLADHLRVSYSSSIIVENKPGAAARVSVEYVKASEPDGTTMLITPDFPITVYPHSFRSLSYAPSDLAPVAPITHSMLTFNVGPMVPASVRTLADWVAWCKANPEQAVYATTSAGSTPHFVGVMLSNTAGVPMQPVHYRGGAPALQDLLGGHVPASINPIGESMPHAVQGQLRILAVTGAQRSKFLPDVPTMKEQGFDVVINSWIGVFLPAATPRDTVLALSAALEKVAASPDYAASLATFGNEPNFESVDAFAARVKADLERWGPVVKASGFVAVD